MDEAFFKISFDPHSQIISARVSGFWSLKVVDEYTAALAAEVMRIRQSRLSVRIIIDSSVMKAQAPEIGARFVASWQTILIGAEDRAAIVVESALAALQFRRIYQTERCHVFASLGEAKAWLLAAE